MLDTNIAIYVIKHRPLELLETFNTHAGQMCISSITLAELSHGVEKSRPMGRYLLPGSASFDLLRQSGESLVGRVSYLELCPFVPGQRRLFLNSLDYCACFSYLLT